MKKGIGILIIVIVALIWGGYACAYVFQSESQQDTSQGIPDGATGVTFYNNGNSWVHEVAVFENVLKKDGTTGNIYADIWIKPKENGIPGTASTDLSSIAGYGNQPLPQGTKIRMNIWGNLLGPVSTDTLKLQIRDSTAQSGSLDNIEKSNIQVLPLPQGITDNKVKTTEDPSAGGDLLSKITSSGTTATWNYAKSFTLDGTGIVHAQSIEDATLCLIIAAGGGKEVTEGKNQVTTGETIVSNNQPVTGENKLPLQKTGLPIIPALLSVFTVAGGLIYNKLRN